MEKLLYQTFREGYGIDQVRRTMTVGELIDFLSDYDEDTPIYLDALNEFSHGRASAHKREASQYGAEDAGVGNYAQRRHEIEAVAKGQ